MPPDYAFNLDYTQSYNEKELLHNISDGDEQAFAALFETYYPKVRLFVARFFQHDDQAEDALQEVFIKVWLQRDLLPEIENFAAWLRTVTSRVCINALRRNVSAERRNTEWMSRQQGEVASLEEKIIAGETRHLVLSAVSNMPAARQRIYRMSREEGLKPAEIAGKLSLSVNTVRNTLVTALKEIRNVLEAHGRVISLYFLFYFLQAG